MIDKKCKANYTTNAKHILHLRGVNLENKIAALRRQRRLSQEELALAVGVTRQTITSIEVGKYTASLPLAFKIARYFGMAIEDVFNFTEYVNEMGETNGKV